MTDNNNPTLEVVYKHCDSFNYVTTELFQHLKLQFSHMFK